MAYTPEERKKIPQELLDKYWDQYKNMYGTGKPLTAPKKSPLILGNPPNNKMSNNKMSKVPIDSLTKSVLCGTCLSDASLRINTKYANARIQTRHSTRQYTWFFWKWIVVGKNYINGIPSIVFQNPDGYQNASPEQKDEKLGKLKLASKAHKDLTSLHEILCPEGKEKIELGWLENMTDYFLMVIWLDDGSLYHTYQGCICLDATPKEELEIFSVYLKDYWKVNTYVGLMPEIQQSGAPRHRIYFSKQEDLLEFLRIVAPKIPVKEMLYKVMFVPKNNPKLLQRWATELKGLVLPEFRDYVEKEYEKIMKEQGIL